MTKTDKKTETEGPWEKYLKYGISAFVSVTHVIAFFQIVICSRHLAVAFNIPAKNIGIYFAKLYSLRSVLMSFGCGIEYGIFKVTSLIGEKNIRRYLSMAWFVLLTICEVSFLCVLYFSKSVAFHNYIVLNLEGMLFGFFQMSILSLIPEFASYYMLSLYISGTSIFIIQTIIDRCTKNSMLSVKIQAWICVICSVICVGLWPIRLFVLKDTTQTSQTNSGSTSCSSTSTSTTPAPEPSAATQSPSVSSSSGAESSAPGGGSMEYVMSLTSLTILKIMTCKLSEASSGLTPDAIINVQMLMTRLEQIRAESQITYDVLVAIDLVILSLKKCGCQENQLCLLAELSLFLRMKVLIKPLEKQKEKTIQELSYAYAGLGVQNGKQCSSGEPVVMASARYTQLIKSVQSRSASRQRRDLSEESKSRARRSTQIQQPQASGKGFHEHLFASLSPLMMFGTGSLVKDFLFPGVIPYALLERDKCHLINLIVIIFLSIGPVTIFIINEVSGLLKEKVDPYHWFWTCMIPKIVIFLISLSAIHSKQGCTHQIRSSRWRVFLMTMILLTCYGFLETMSFVGMAFYVKIISCEPKPFDLLAIHNVSGKFFRYFVYKLSVGYNKTRISSGFVLPSFIPPEPIPNTFGFWFKGAFSNGWKDLKSDFKFNIKQYLEVAPTVSKKSPIETLRYCDIFM